MQSPNSFFRPYYDILPEDLSCMPIFWKREELEYLTGSYLLNQIDERIVTTGKDYEAICEAAPEFAEICTVERFQWARMIVCSRNFGLAVNGIKTAVLVPYADMLNHLRPRETMWQFDDSSQCFTVVSTRAIDSGAQVYDSYGQKSNHRFLLNYGFSIERNLEPDGYCPNEVGVIVPLHRHGGWVFMCVYVYRYRYCCSYIRTIPCTRTSSSTSGSRSRPLPTGASGWRWRTTTASAPCCSVCG